jgi:predicted nucleic acid-binding protein
VLDLITESNYTAYDCEFVALANELNVQLVTADKQLLTRFPERTISLEEFVK